MSEIKAKSYDVEAVRECFPILHQEINDRPLVYLDSAATTQKPLSVIDAMSRYYKRNNANVHRGIYTLSERATHQYEAARQTVKSYIGARHNHEIIFTRSATEAMNLVANSFSELSLTQGDEVVITLMEHHSCIVPWQQACKRHGARLRVANILSDGNLDTDHLQSMLNERTKMVAIIQVSNVLGVVNPVKQITAMAHARGIPVMVDGTQAMPHCPVSVQDLDCDFYVFSGHKMYGPTGVGVLYGKEEWLERLPPYQFGGDMIKSVSFEGTEFNELPHKFEAGTTNISGVIGLAEAIQFIRKCEMKQLQNHESKLMKYALEKLQTVDGMNVLFPAEQRVGVISFTLDYAHPHDIATILDQAGVAIRSGHHCAMPLMQYLRVPATARLSFGAYTTLNDIDRCVDGLQRVAAIFK